MKKIKLEVDGGYIHGTLQGPFEESSQCPAILVIHGLTSKEDKYITRFKELAKKGYICLTISLRGHGKSSGTFKSLSRQNHINDVEAAFAYLKSLKSVDGKRIGIYGKSYGGYITAILSSKLKPKTIILGAPALYVNGDMTESLGVLLENDPEAWKKFNLDSNKNIALKSLNMYTGKTLLLVFGNDIEVPKATTDTYLRLKASIKTETIRDANHGLDKPVWDKQAMKIINQWYQDNL